MPFTARLPSVTPDRWEPIRRALTHLVECMEARPTIVDRIETDSSYLAQLVVALTAVGAAMTEARLKNDVISANSWPFESQAESWARAMFQLAFEPSLTAEKLGAWLGQTNAEGDRPAGDPAFFDLMRACLANFTSRILEMTEPDFARIPIDLTKSTTISTPGGGNVPRAQIISPPDLPRYRRALNRTMLTWNLLAAHVWARLAAELRRSHNISLDHRFIDDPDIPRTFPEGCASFQEALRQLSEFDSVPADMPWLQCGHHALTSCGLPPSVDSWLDSLKTIGQDEWRENVVDPFLDSARGISSRLQAFFDRFEQVKEEVIAASQKKLETRLHLSRALQEVQAEERARNEEQVQRRKRLLDLLAATVNSTGPCTPNEPTKEWAKRLASRLVCVGQEIQAQQWEDWFRETAKGEQLLRDFAELILAGDEEGIVRAVTLSSGLRAEYQALCEWLKALARDWPKVFDQGWLRWRLACPSSDGVSSERVDHASPEKAGERLVKESNGSTDQECLPFPPAEPLFSDALDRVVVVEDKSDEDYLLLWMKKILPQEQWRRLSARKFCLPSEGRPTGDGVNRVLNTIKQIHPEERNLQPEAFILADRDYRLDEELEKEARKLKGEAFLHQIWHVWHRVEIENYLLCPDALVRYVLERSPAGSAAGTEWRTADENELRALIECLIESSRSPARAQLIESFARRNREEKKGWQTSTLVQKAEEHLDSVWHADQRLVWCDAKEVILPRLREEIKKRWNLALSEPDLINCLKPEEIPAEIAETVREIASFLLRARWSSADEPKNAQVRALFEALRNEDPGIRRQAAEGLSEKGRSAVPGLVRAMRDEDAVVRLEAAQSLNEIGREAVGATESLISGLEDKDPAVREMSMRALGSIGAEARAAVPALIKALAPKEWRMRLAAVDALGKIGAVEAVRSLIEVLKDKGVPARDGAAQALGEIGPSAAEAVPDLLLALREDDNPVRARSATALGKIGTTGPEVCLGLTNALKDQDHDVRRAAVEAMGLLGLEVVAEP